MKNMPRAVNQGNPSSFRGTPGIGVNPRLGDPRLLLGGFKNKKEKVDVGRDYSKQQQGLCFGQKLYPKRKL